MRLTVWGLILVMLCATTSLWAQKGTELDAADAWYIYKSKFGRVRVDFPGKYSVDEKMESIGTNVTVKLQRGGGELYMLNFLVYSEYRKVRKADPMELIKESMETFAANMNFEVNEVKPVWNGKSQGLSTTADLPDGKTISYACFLIGHTEYQLVAITDGSEGAIGRVNYFMNSFESKAK